MITTHLTLIAAAVIAGATVPVPVLAQITYPPPPSPYPNIVYDSSVRVEVTPRDSEVYVDGYLAGSVDDFDGMWQRLRVEPGQHEIAVYHEGYRTAVEHVYLVRDRTFKIKRDLEPLPPGSPSEPRPTPVGPPPRGSEPPRPLPRSGSREDAPPLPDPARNGTGRLQIRVEPADADVRIDGEPWEAAPGVSRTALDLPAGRHLVQVRKPGYVSYATEVDVRSGETTNVEATLRPAP